MEKKEDEPDFSSLNKYFIEDNSAEKSEPIKVNTIIEDVSIKESTFRSYKDSEEKDYEITTQEVKQKIEKKGCPHKIKFLKKLSGEDNSLTLDTCNSINKDWKKR